MRWLAQVAAFWVFQGVASAYTFGGFDDEGSSYLKRGPDDQVCAAPPDSACHAVDKRTARGFVKPPRSRGYAVSIEDGTSIRLSEGERVIGTIVAAARVTGVNGNVFVSSAGALVAVEYQMAGGEADVAVFSLAPTPPSTAPTGAPADPAGGKTAYERALRHGGTWEQRLVACDQAGVNLALHKTRRFEVKIVTRCQAQKSTTQLDGTFVTEGDGTLVLQFANADGPLEKMECHFATCSDRDEDCLTCAQDDIAFTMGIVRR